VEEAEHREYPKDDGENEQPTNPDLISGWTEFDSHNADSLLLAVPT
jgi:hypothetical protein